MVDALYSISLPWHELELYLDWSYVVEKDDETTLVSVKLALPYKDLLTLHRKQTSPTNNVKQHKPADISKYCNLHYHTQ